MVAMREVFGTDATTFGQFAVVDVACASLWMAILLFLANRAQQIDTRNGADTRAIDEMKARISAYEAQNARIPSMTDLMVIVGVALGASAWPTPSPHRCRAGSRPTSAGPASSAWTASSCG